MTLERVGIRKDTTKILELVREYNCDTIVIGLPKKLDGTDSLQTEKVYEFRRMLENKMRSTAMKGIEVVWQDERLTTVMAEKVLIEADVSRKKRKQVIDKQAAVLIMQSYLDSQAFKGSPRGKNGRSILTTHILFVYFKKNAGKGAEKSGKIRNMPERILTHRSDVIKFIIG